MTQTRLIALSLTFLMLLLVLTAAFVFTFQAQATLQRELAQSRTGLAAEAAGGTRTAVLLAEQVATRAVLQERLATAEAESRTLEGQLTQKVAEAESLSATAVAQAEAWQNEVAQLQQLVAGRGPTLVLDIWQRPRAAGESLQFWAAASDAQGIAWVEVSVNGGIPVPYTGEERPLFTRLFSETIATAGPYTVTVTAYNVNRASQTAVITGTVQTIAALRQTEILTLLQNQAAADDLQPIAPPVLLRRAIFSQWLAVQFGDLSANRVAQEGRVLQAFGLLTAEEAADLPQYVTQWQQTDFAALLYDETTDQLFLLDEAALSGEWADWMLLVEETTPDLGGILRPPDAHFALMGQALGYTALRQALYLAAGGQTAVQPPAATASAPLLPNMPAVLRQQLIFPYVQGYEWALALYRQGGLAAVDIVRQAQFFSSAELLYGTDLVQRPVARPDLASVLTPEWQLQGQGVWGAFRAQQFLAAQGVTEGETAVAGWTGDEYAVYWRAADGALLLFWQLSWQTPESATRLAAIFSAASPAFLAQSEWQPEPDGYCWQGQEEIFCAYTQGNETLLLRAPDQELAQALRQVWQD